MPRFAIMEVYLGFKRETAVSVLVRDRGCGAGETKCFECSGTGKWPYHPEPIYPTPNCVVCKGTGFILIGIA